jgi:hypothetical protein
MQGHTEKLSSFDKWWDCPKKHFKRVHCWLPRLKEVVRKLSGRGLRYFTLCARPMIDIFMLLDDGLLKIDFENRAIPGVQFCEVDENSYIEIVDMLAREDAGFYGKLEDVALFQDDDYTERFGSLREIEEEREREGEALPQDRLTCLRLKSTALLFQSSFPYDFVNLDFCDYYYQRPPAVFRIDDTVGRFLDWQRRSGSGADAVTVNDFILAVTCRYDESFPSQAKAFLAELVKNNCKQWSEYDETIRKSKGMSVDEWIEAYSEDLFFAAWPKHVAQKASELGWESEILDYVHYQRPADRTVPFVMICLVMRFTRSQAPSDLAAALYAIESDNRKQIPEISWDSDDGKTLRHHLERVRKLRNEQARRRGRIELPEIGDRESSASHVPQS